ncbi:hypothetical protein HMPREF0208_02544 [Citrobacter koseri]|nr:hypothetical protein HMPREF3220_03001 [Citrobacter koseri]KXA01355.1 hypothetical protein HMPREF3207_02852 [Citrobacter koseri]KXB43545.1 hypothetical protein HMPREF0208_02544 [Citrobacter koseri]
MTTSEMPDGASLSGLRRLRDAWVLPPSGKTDVEFVSNLLS